jgi:5-(carboxyamino)imidazole ribonucleotide mutase
MAYSMVEVAIIAGSASDAAIVDKAAAVLKEQGISYESRFISAHREPDILDEYIRKSDCKVFIAIAGLSAALPGVIASKTNRPVIGVPVSGNMMGVDALLSIVQMPKGVPVACVGIDNGENAALLAVRILHLK